MVVSACSTFERAPQKHPAAPWSGLEPLQIPYDVRWNRFEMGNLVANPSFEDGRAAGPGAESGGRIEGWEMVGQNVRWVDRRSANDSREEVNSGHRAVRILRKTAHELDEAEGVISDYIAVIPGNYIFSYHIKLKNISNNKRRLGVKLYDAVVIKVLFFDADKQPIEPGAWNPVGGSLMDNSDKSYSFSNFEPSMHSGVS